MKNIVYLIVLLTCYRVQATIGNAVDFVVQTVSELNKEKEQPKPLPKKVVVKQESTHISRALGRELIVGVGVTMVPQAAYCLYRIIDSYLNQSFELDDIEWFDQHVSLLSMGVCVTHGIYGVIHFAASDSSFSGVIKNMTRFAGSLATAGLLYKFTCLYE